MDRDNVLYVKSVASGMFNGWIFSIRLRAKKVFIAGIVQSSCNYRTLLRTESEGEE